MKDLLEMAKKRTTDAIEKQKEYDEIISQLILSRKQESTDKLTKLKDTFERYLMEQSAKGLSTMFYTRNSDSPDIGIYNEFAKYVESLGFTVKTYHSSEPDCEHTRNRKASVYRVEISW